MRNPRRAVKPERGKKLKKSLVTVKKTPSVFLLAGTGMLSSQSLLNFVRRRLAPTVLRIWIRSVILTAFSGVAENNSSTTD